MSTLPKTRPNYQRQPDDPRRINGASHLVTSIDTGGERFGFFLPQLDVPRGQSEEFRTAGVYETFSGPDSIPHRDPSWRCTELHGTAQTVIAEF